MSRPTPDHPADGSPLAAVVAAQQRRIAELSTALRYRAVIEQAKGVLVGRVGCHPDEAFTWLVERSQRSNRKLTRVAAAVVAGALEDGPRRDLDVEARRHPLLAHVDGPDTDRVLLAAALDSAGDLTTLAQRLVEEGLGWHGADACALHVVEPDGAVQQVATAGFAGHERSAWRRVPPDVPTPLTAAVRDGAPVLSRSGDETASRFPVVPAWRWRWGAVADVPVRLDGHVIGVLQLAWRDEGPTPWPRAELEELAAACAHPLADLVVARPDAAGDGPRGDLPGWFRDALDALAEPVWVLLPDVEDDGTVVGHSVVHANRACADRAAPDLDGDRVRTAAVGRYVLVACGPAGDPARLP